MIQIKTIKERYAAFREWQQRPYEVAPLLAEEHDCPTCHTHYMGNYCPRCGQSARIGRYSFKNALLLFLDVWGLGNRGMFRTLRDLLLRPGYMIRDYLSGMQMAYFPPFKMLFLLTTLSILVAHGLNIKGTSQKERQRQELISMQTTSAEEHPDAGDVAADEFNKKWIDRVYNIQEHYPNLLSLGFIVLMSSFYYIFFRKSKTIPDLRYSEFFIGMVYTANMLSIYETVMTFFCLPVQVVSYASVLTVIPLKQLSGFTWKRTILSMLGAIVLIGVVVFGLIVIGVIVGILFFPEYFSELVPEAAN